MFVIVIACLYEFRYEFGLELWVGLGSHIKSQFLLLQGGMGELKIREFLALLN